MPPGLIERYRDRLPVSAATPVVTLGEGSTPLLEAPRVSERAGLPRCYLKYEGANPTGSFKDRGMTMAVSKALEEGAREAVCASTGNTSASAAAYCAPRRPAARGRAAGGRDRARKAGAGPDRRRARDRRPGRLRRRARARPRARRAARRGAPELRQPVPPRGPEDGGVRGGGAARRACPTGWRCRSETAATSPPTGRGSARSALRRDMLAGQAEGAAPLSPAGRWRTPRRWRRRSGSATRPGSTRRSRRCRSRPAACGRCPTTRSWPPTACSRRRRACSASRPRRRRSARPARGERRRARRAGLDGRLRADRARPEGPRHGRRRGRRDPALPAAHRPPRGARLRRRGGPCLTG